MIYLCLKMEFGFKPGPYFKDAFLLICFSHVFHFCGFCFFFRLSGSMGQTLRCLTRCAQQRNLGWHRGKKRQNVLRKVKRSRVWMLRVDVLCQRQVSLADSGLFMNVLLGSVCFMPNPPFPEIWHLEHLYFRA